MSLSFQSAAAKDEKFSNINALAIKDCKEQPKEIRDQCKKTSIQSPRNIQERLVRTDELVDRSQKFGQRKNSTRPAEESRTNVRIWDETNAKALTRKYCDYTFGFVWTAALILP